MAKKSETKATETVAPTGRPVVVTTAHRGVFFGYAANIDGEQIRLERARMCHYWSADCRGVVGLMAHGPTKGCRISAAVPALTIRSVTAVAEQTPEAAAAWEAAPWG